MRYEIRMLSIFITIATLTSISACSHIAAVELPRSQMTPISRNEQQSRIPAEYLVTLAAGENERIIAEHFARFGIKNIQALGNNTFLLRITDDIGPEGMHAVIEQDTRFKAVQPNFIYKVN